MSTTHPTRRTRPLRMLYTAALVPFSASLARAQDTLPAVTVTVTRAGAPLASLPFAVTVVERRDLSAARPTWGLDEALAGVPGVLAQSRSNFSLDQRLAIRGFGARSAFAVRGVKVLLDGIPQTLPDGQGQLTHVELGATDRIEVLRGSASALYGNAAGGVISISTGAALPARWNGEARIQGGPGWLKWLATSRSPVGRGGGLTLTASRLAYDGWRVHSGADLRNAGARLRLPLGPRWSLTAAADLGDQPRADNPGALTNDELHANRDTAPPINLATRAGKDVFQAQGGVTVRRTLGNGGEGDGSATLTLFGLTRDLENPQTFAYIRLDRVARGARVVIARRWLTAGVDLQRQRDDRRNFGNAGGVPDTVSSLDQLEHVTEIGPFVQAAVPLTPRSTVTAGARYDRVGFDVRDRLVGDSAADAKYRDDSGRRVMAAASGSLGATVRVAEGATAYASVASSFETPTTTELANRPDTAGGMNRELEPQRAWTFETGVRGARGHVTWDVALFQANVSGALVPYEIATSPGRRFFRNAGSARHRGVEAAARWAPAPGLDVRATWTYSDFRYRRYAFTAGGVTHVLDGRPLPGVPRHMLRLALRGRPAAGGGAWAELETLHASRSRLDDTTSAAAAAWWATNVRLGWEGTRWAPFVALQNVFNRRYVGSVVVNAARGRYYEPAPGRNLLLGLTLAAGGPAAGRPR